MAHSRRSSIAGFVLAAAGLTILGSHGPAVGAAPTEAKVPVAGKVGFVTAPTATVSLVNGSNTAGAPGETVSADVSMKVESNKAYIITATPQATALTSSTSDTIPATALKTVDSSGGAADFGAAVEIVRTDTKSDATTGGDTHVSPLSMTVPWVEPGEYTISIEYTVSQL